MGPSSAKQKTFRQMNFPPDGPQAPQLTFAPSKDQAINKKIKMNVIKTLALSLIAGEDENNEEKQIIDISARLSAASKLFFHPGT